MTDAWPRTTWFGWPTVPSQAFPGERTWACPKCWSTNITYGSHPGAYGTAPGGRWRMGDAGGCNYARCNDCGEEKTFSDRPKR